MATARTDRIRVISPVDQGQAVLGAQIISLQASHHIILITTTRRDEEIGITNLLKVFPSLGDNSAKEQEYNRRMRYEYEAVRDFIILHYHLTEREDTPFWKHVKHMEVPEGLQQKMAAFEEAGHLYRIDDELFTEVGWLQVMLGQGLRPRSYNPLADTLSSKDVEEYLRNLKTIFATTVGKLQPYEEFVKSCAV